MSVSSSAQPIPKIELPRNFENHIRNTFPESRTNAKTMAPDLDYTSHISHDFPIIPIPILPSFFQHRSKESPQTKLLPIHRSNTPLNSSKNDLTPGEQLPGDFHEDSGRGKAVRTFGRIRCEAHQSEARRDVLEAAGPDSSCPPGLAVSAGSPTGSIPREPIVARPG